MATGRNRGLGMRLSCLPPPPPCRTAIMDAHLDPSDILNLFTDLAEKRAINGTDTIKLAQGTITELQALTRRDD